MLSFVPSSINFGFVIRKSSHSAFIYLWRSVPTFWILGCSMFWRRRFLGDSWKAFRFCFLKKKGMMPFVWLEWFDQLLAVPSANSFPYRLAFLMLQWSSCSQTWTVRLDCTNSDQRLKSSWTSDTTALHTWCLMFIGNKVSALIRMGCNDSWRFTRSGGFCNSQEV